MGNDKAVAITAELISAYLKNNAVGADDIPQLAQHVPELIRRIHEAFARLPDPAGSDGHDHAHEHTAEGVLEVIGLFPKEVPPPPAPTPPAPTRPPPSRPDPSCPDPSGADCCRCCSPATP